MKPEQLIDLFSLSGLIASIVSIILAFFAIWLAWQFYKQAKKSETRAEVALAEIKSQTDTLQKLTGSQIRSLTKAVTGQSPTEKALLDTLKDITTNNAIVKDNISAPEAGADATALRTELIMSYIAMHHYSALANNAFSFAYRNAVTDADVKNGLLKYVEYTYKDYQHMENVIGLLNNNEITQSTMHHLYTETETSWKPHVINAEQLKSENQA